MFRFLIEKLRSNATLFALCISIAALTVSIFSAVYQYKDNTSTGVKFTNFIVSNNPLGLAEGGVDLTIFNYGNRAILINDFSIFLQTGDYKTLLENQTPPCTYKLGMSFLNYDPMKMVTTVINNPKIIEAQHLLSIPIAFHPLFEDSIKAEGTVCILLHAYNYTGYSREVVFPLGMMKVVKSQSPNETPVYEYTKPRGGETKNIYTIF